MKIAAVIAEYNPFHNGHLYQLQTLRNECGADRIIVVLSGEFTQRGIPAITDKFHRSRLALENGADLVLELPVYFSCGSAEYFAKGAVTMLDKLGVVSMLHFGSEEGTVNLLQECANIFLTEPESYQLHLKQYIKQGDSFPIARSKALLAYAKESASAQPLLQETMQNNMFFQHAISADQLKQICSSPNNILGIEYIKELQRRNSSIRPLTLKREGSRYEDTAISEATVATNAINTNASANAIRQLIENGQDCQSLSDYVPHNVLAFLQDNTDFTPMFSDDFSSYLYYKLLSESYQNKNDLSQYYDMTKQLSDVFLKNINSFETLTSFSLACKSKEITYTRIARCLMHILLDMSGHVMQELKATDAIHYARVLGFSEQGKDIMKQIKANASIPLITKLPKALQSVTGIARTSLLADIHAAQVYQGICAQKYHRPIKNEYTQEIVRIP